MVGCVVDVTVDVNVAADVGFVDGIAVSVLCW